MSDHLTPERLAAIRGRTKLQCGLDDGTLHVLRDSLDQVNNVYSAPSVLRALVDEVLRLRALRADLENAVANHARGIGGDIYSIVHILDRDIRRRQQ